MSIRKNLLKITKAGKTRLRQYYIEKREYLAKASVHNINLAPIMPFIYFILVLGSLVLQRLTQLSVSFLTFCIVSCLQPTSGLSLAHPPKSSLSDANDKVDVIIVGVNPRSLLLSMSLNQTIGDIFEELRRRHLIPKLGRVRQVLYFDQCRHSPLRHTEVLRDIGIASLSVLHLRTIILGGLDDEIDSEYIACLSPYIIASSSSEKLSSSTVPHAVRTSPGHSLSPAPFKKINNGKAEDWILKLQGRAPIADIPGHSELWKGMIHQPDTLYTTTIPVVVKYPRNPLGAVTFLKNEIRTYGHIRHKYIASFYGIHEADDDLLALVIPWYNYNALTYLKKFAADRLALIIQLAEVICYLHLHGIYHGDLKASNLMVDENGDLKLIDFGLSRIVKEKDIVCERHFSRRWAPPEFYSSDDPISAASDVYSFGSTVLELLTGQYPYNKVRDFPVILTIARGDSPRPHTTTDGCDISEGLWNIMEQCWAKASERPSMDVVLAQLQTYRDQMKK